MIPIRNSLVIYMSFFKDSSPYKFFRSTRRIIGESLTALLICAIGDLIAGIILGRMTLFLEAFPGLLVIIPGAIGMRGNIFGSLASRLSTHLHIGTLAPKIERSRVLDDNIISSLFLTIILSILLALMAYVFCIIFGFKCMSIVDFVIISVFTGIISSIFLLPSTVLISIKSFKHGWDPDNITTPLIAATGDMLTLPSIILATIVFTAISSPIIRIVIFYIIIIVSIVLFVWLLYSKHDEMKRIIKQSIFVLFICSILGTTTGTVLNSRLSFILSNPSILTLVPLFSGQSGDLTSILGARLSSILHSGCIEPVLIPQDNTKKNLMIIVILSLFVYPFIGFLAHFGGVYMGIPSIGLLNMMTISTLAGLILLPILLTLSFYLSIGTYKRGLDPDNIVIPISTSLIDPIATSILVGVVILILGF